MNSTISIKTPENIEFSYEVAAIGSRFVANLLDTLIQSAILGSLSASLTLGGLISFRLNASFAPWVLAVAVVAGFAIFIGYYMTFEIVWNGQTPGKRMVGLRVVKEGGYPIGISDAVVRNMLRSVDFLPFFYALGVLFMLFNEKSKRLGDYVAGTIVVKERKLSAPKSVDLNALSLSQDQNPYHSAHSAYRLSNGEIELIFRFLGRRHSFKDRSVRERLAKKLAHPLAQKLQVDLSSIAGQEEQFLESLVSTE